MTDTDPVHMVRREGRLLYVLLDAADSNGMLNGTANKTRWDEAKLRVQWSGDFDTDAELYHEMLTELAASGRLAGTWIEDRWLAVNARIAGVCGESRAVNPG